jgi:hypothetical protein
MERELLSTNSIGNRRAPFATHTERKRRAIELYETTDLTSGAIGAEVGVSRETVYRWLKKEGVPIRRNRIRYASNRPAQDVIRLNAAIAELRGDILILAGEVRRLARLVEAPAETQHGVSVAPLAA